MSTAQNTIICTIHYTATCSRCSFSMMVKLANDGVLQTNATKMLVNDGEMLVNDPKLLSPSLISISPSLTSIMGRL